MTGNNVSGPLFSTIFFFFSVVNVSHGTAALTKKPILQKLTLAPKNLEVDPFPDPSVILRPPGGHFGFSRWFGVPGSVALQAVSKCPHCYWADIKLLTTIEA